MERTDSARTDAASEAFGSFVADVVDVEVGEARDVVLVVHHGESEPMRVRAVEQAGGVFEVELVVVESVKNSEAVSSTGGRKFVQALVERAVERQWALGEVSGPSAILGPGIPMDPAFGSRALLRLVDAKLAARGVTVDGLSHADLERAADALIAALPQIDPAAAAIGPFYDTAGLTAWLGISRQALHARVARRRMLAVTTTDTPPRTLYPAWQFTGTGDTLAGVGEALDALAPAGWSDLTTALWFAGPTEELGGMSAAQWLQAGHPADVVVDAARRDISAWNR